MILAAPAIILPPDKPAIVRASDLRGLPSWQEMQRKLARIERATFPFPFVPPALSGNVVVTTIGTGVSTSGATATVSVPAGGVPAGAAIFLGVNDQSAAAPGGSATDTNAVGYTAAAGVNLNNNSAFGFIRLFYLPNAGSLVSGNLITYTKASSGSTCALTAFYATGIKTSSPLDLAVTAFGNDAAPTVSSGAAAEAGELFVGLMGTSGARTFTQATGFVTPPDQSVTGSCQVNGGYLINSGTTSKTANFGINSGTQWGALIASFKHA